MTASVSLMSEEVTQCKCSQLSNKSWRGPRWERDDLQPGKWEPGCEHPEGSCDPGRGHRGVGWPGGRGSLVNGHTSARKLGDRDKAGTQGTREEMDYGIMDYGSGRRLETHGECGGNQIVLTRSLSKDLIVVEKLMLNFLLKLVFKANNWILYSQFSVKRLGDKWENILTDWNI